YTDIDEWRSQARQRLLERIAQPDTGGTPSVTVKRQYTYDGLHIAELSWQLPYGPPTSAVFLKPAGATGPLPGTLGLHCHSGLKYFGLEKITRTSDERHPIMVDLHARNYDGQPWANEIARRGYAVLVHDTFAFGSRRVRVQDVIAPVRGSASVEG